MAHWLLGQARIAQGRTDEGLTELQSAIDLSKGLPWMSATKGVCLVSGRRLDEARDILAELKERASREYVRALLLGQLHGSLDESDAAFLWLEKAVEDRDPHLAFAHIDAPMPGLVVPRNIRPDSRFGALMQRRGLVV